MPPLGIFYNENYKTMGIEIDDNQIALSNEFEKRHNIELNIFKGNIRNLPFKDEFMQKNLLIYI